MPSEKEISLAIYRLERAKEMLCDARSLFEKVSFIKPVVTIGLGLF